MEHHASFRFSSLSFVCGSALLATALVPTGSAQAATRVVSNCNDSGAGSLRAAVAASVSGDSIDLTGLTCPRIVLTSGQIVVPQNDLNLFGPGRFALTIDGNMQSRVFSHTGTGLLYLSRMSIARGNEEAPSGYITGGCIDSLGTVELVRSRVHHCRVWTEDVSESLTTGGGINAPVVLLSFSSVFYSTAGQNGYGGGISGGTITLYRSQVYGNANLGHGGGISGGTVTLVYSLVHGNTANWGGGIAAVEVTINKSTISANRAVDRPFLGPGQSRAGGIFTQVPGRRHVIVDSTISGNTAYEASGLDMAGEVVVFNSTIADNLENAPDDADMGVCTGVGAVRVPTLRVESSIVAGNRCILPGALDIAPGTAVTGSHNLIGSSAVALPADTISADPRLAPLAENGGPVRTHLPLADSPAIDRGSNVLNRAYDERGPGFPRVKGPAPDIGAVER